MKIGFDVDGVLADFYSAYEKLHIEVAGVDLFGPSRYPAVLPQIWDWPSQFGYTKDHTKEVWKRIKADDEFWYMLGTMPDVEALKLMGLYAPGHDIYFITDRVGLHVKAQTEAWLVEHTYFPRPTALISGQKGLCCKALGLDVYVDDKGENILDVEAASPATRAYLLYRPYNAHVFPDIGAHTLLQVLHTEGIVDSDKYR